MRSTLLAWLQLMRLPNVFTVWADVTMAFCVVLGVGVFELTAATAATYALLLLAASLMYIAGMVLNDVHDLPEDTRQRAERPIVAGRISLAAARAAGYGMLATGTVCYIMASKVAAWGAVPLVIMLAVCILAYNTRLKDTLLGPVLMGLCRAMNILAVMIIAEPTGMLEVLADGCVSLNYPKEPFSSPIFLIPLAIGVYITGVTLYARNETDEGMQKSGVLGGTLAVILMVGGIMLLFPWVERVRDMDPLLLVISFAAQPWRWAMLVLFLAVYVGMKTLLPLLSGNPYRVRRGVKLAIFTLFILDAGLALTIVALPTALAILAMMLAAVVMGRWIYTT